jgi:hypothetical protein
MESLSRQFTSASSISVLSVVREFATAASAALTALEVIASAYVTNIMKVRRSNMSKQRLSLHN